MSKSQNIEDERFQILFCPTLKMLVQEASRLVTAGWVPAGEIAVRNGDGDARYFFTLAMYKPKP